MDDDVSVDVVDTSNDVSDVSSGSSDTVGDIPVDVPDDIPEDVPEEPVDAVSAEIPEAVSDDIGAESGFDYTDQNPNTDIIDDIPEDNFPDEEMTSDVSAELPEEIAEDISSEDVEFGDNENEIPDEISEDVSDNLSDEDSTEGAETPEDDAAAEYEPEIPEDVEAAEVQQQAQEEYEMPGSGEEAQGNAAEETESSDMQDEQPAEIKEDAVDAPTDTTSENAEKDQDAYETEKTEDTHDDASEDTPEEMQDVESSQNQSDELSDDAVEESGEPDAEKTDVNSSEQENNDADVPVNDYQSETDEKMPSSDDSDDTVAMDMKEDDTSSQDQPADLDKMIDKIMESDLTNEHKKELLEDIKAHLTEGNQQSLDSGEGFDDGDDGAAVKVKKLTKGDTVISHHDYQKELDDLDEGITNWQAAQEDIANNLNAEYERIMSDDTLSDFEKNMQLAQNDQKRELLAAQYEKEFADLKNEREILVNKLNGNQTSGNQTSYEPDSSQNTTDGRQDDFSNIMAKDIGDSVTAEDAETTDLSTDQLCDDPEYLKEHGITEVCETPPDIGTVQAWLTDVNPNFDGDPYSPYSNNCGACAAVVEAKLSGHDAVEAGTETLSIDEMNMSTGMIQTPMDGYDEIQEKLLSCGPGAHAVIGIDRVSGPGHWFNAYTPDGVNLYAIDGQTGEILDWPPNYGDECGWDMSLKAGGNK
jgi:hypothetical protein